MKKFKAVVIGNFSFGQGAFNGQTAKTRDYNYYICERFGQECVAQIDTAAWKKNPVKLMADLVWYCANSENIVLMLGINGSRLIIPIVAFLKSLYKYRILFPMVGGSVMYEFEQHKLLQKCFPVIDAIYFETKMMTDYFKGLGYKNVYYAPVFTKRKCTTGPDIESSLTFPLKFCTYSRVCKEKGIGIAMDAVRRVNEYFGKIVCTLDIFGVPYPEFEEEFSKKLKECDGFIASKPYLQGDHVIDTLSEYALMLFPTYYGGEGFPIAVVECMLGGVPTIASNWHYNSEIVLNNKTGVVFEPNEVDVLADTLISLVNDPEKIRVMKLGCLENAKNFTPELVLEDLFNRISAGE